MLMAQGRHFCLLPRSVLIDQFLTFAISMNSVVNDSVGDSQKLQPNWKRRVSARFSARPCCRLTHGGLSRTLIEKHIAYAVF